ncbi:MAG: zinc-ribbon domain-containing protein [Nitrospirae bacterium]|nr:zinc-ribbon domain-containing protein [Nitrospirota bacterium]
MALFDCPECKHKISDRAVTCPHCGLPQPTDYKKELEWKNKIADFEALSSKERTPKKRGRT